MNQSAADSAWGVEQGIGYAWNGRLAVLTVMHITKADRHITDRADWYIRKASPKPGRPARLSRFLFTTNQTIIPGFRRRRSNHVEHREQQFYGDVKNDDPPARQLW